MHIGIAGAGIIGRLLALQLHKQGHKISLFDQDPIVDESLCDYAAAGDHLPSIGSNACSYTAAGMLTPFSEAEIAEPLIFQLGLASLSLWPKLISGLNTEVYYQTGGTLVVAHQQDQADFNRFSNSVYANVNPNEQQMRMLNQRQLSELEPELSSRFRQAAYLPDEAWLCSCCIMPALAQNLLSERIAWHSNTEVSSVEPGTITLASARQQQHNFDIAIDTRGLGAKSALPGLRGVRGEILWVRAPDVNIKHLLRLMHPRYRIYIVPRRDNLCLIGATQIESEDYNQITVRSSLELLSAAYSVHPGFGEASIVKSDINCRPALPDNQPKIYHREGLIQVNGLFRHGYLMGPAIAEEVSTHIDSQGTHSSSYQNLFQQLEPCGA